VNGIVKPILKLTYNWDPDGPQGQLEPTIKIDYDVSGATLEDGVWNYTKATVQANLQIWDASKNDYVLLGSTDTVNLGSTTVTWTLNPEGPKTLTSDDLYTIDPVSLNLSKYISTTATVTLDSISVDKTLYIESSAGSVTAADNVQVFLNEQASMDMT
jgi:hypothetical protein